VTNSGTGDAALNASSVWAPCQDGATCSFIPFPAGGKAHDIAWPLTLASVTATQAEWDGMNPTSVAVLADAPRNGTMLLIPAGSVRSFLFLTAVATSRYNGSSQALYAAASSALAEARTAGAA